MEPADGLKGLIARADADLPLARRPGHATLIVAQIEMTSQDRRGRSRMVALALRVRTPAEAQRYRRAI